MAQWSSTFSHRMVIRYDKTTVLLDGISADNQRTRSVKKGPEVFSYIKLYFTYLEASRPCHLQGTPLHS
jgi:hypothetical protein